MLKEGNEKSAISKLNRCVKKGSYYISRRSAETLCTLGNIQDKNKAALNLYQQFPDKDALLITVKQLQSSSEFTRVIDLTQNLNFNDDKDELIKIRLECLKAQHASSYEKEVFDWFTRCPISTFHYQFYRDTYEHPDFDAIYTQEITGGGENPANISFTPEQFAINYRIELYKRNYTYTYAKAKQIINYFSDGNLAPKGQLASDIGKTYLFGSMDFVKNAIYFNNLAEEFINSEMAFYFYFYAGRLFEKGGLYYTQSKKAFENAIVNTNKADQKDNALWYLINTSLNNSLENLLNDIGSYCRQFNDPDYFDDIFDLMISSLLASGNWNAFEKLYKEADGFASDEVVAQLAYIYARLVEEGLAQGDENSKNQAFRRALNADSSYYYKIMASYKLGLSKEEFIQVLERPYKEKETYPSSENTEIDHSKDAQILLEGYAFFGFPEKIYPEYLAVYKKGLPEETYFYLAEFLQKVGEGSSQSDYYTQALRIASRGQTRSLRPVTMDELKLVFPKDYSDLIEKYAEQYNLNPNIIYALIRSESFFDAGVESTAGAVGLSQLMEFTAADIAKKLKLKEYSLTDAEDSIMIGSFYLAELIRRCDNNELLGFFSYNAGITKVRRWLKSTLISFGKKSSMPLDLFLETVPYSETRGYGRKLVSATVMYEFLYGNDDYANIVKDLMKD